MTIASLRKVLFGAALLAICVPLHSCNRQQGNKAQPGQQTMNEDARGSRGHGLRRACGADLQKFCPSEQRGRERRDCLQGHVDQLSADCKAALAERGGRRHRRRNF